MRTEEKPGPGAVQFEAICRAVRAGTQGTGTRSGVIGLMEIWHEHQKNEEMIWKQAGQDMGLSRAERDEARAVARELMGLVDDDYLDRCRRRELVAMHPWLLSEEQ